jgi:hypothetical protein
MMSKKGQESTCVARVSLQHAELTAAGSSPKTTPAEPAHCNRELAVVEDQTLEGGRRRAAIAKVVMSHPPRRLSKQNYDPSRPDYLAGQYALAKHKQLPRCNPSS